MSGNKRVIDFVSPACKRQKLSMSGNKRVIDFVSPACKRQKLSMSSASCSNNQWKYDVFLSFRGEDTRNNFTDHLYAALNRGGINTFRDNERLERGKEIRSELLEAIESSRFSIIVLSKNYAFSTWCLEELAKIVDCMDTEKSNVFPVFYQVDPSDVRKQMGDFKTAFEKHEENFSAEKVQRWRDALTQVANIAGYHSMDRPETRLIEEIVREISSKLNGTSSFVARDLVGIDSRLEEINKLVESGSDDSHFIGIYGMGGIGKTTIARVVFENLRHKYDASCFLSNVREVCEKNGPVHGLVALQKQLLSEVLNDANVTVSDVVQGSMLIRSRLCRKKVFVVLDDVDDYLEQLNNLAGDHDWFGPGSRIVITTRDEQVLISHKIDKKYKAEALNNVEALELFRLIAFGQIPSPSDYIKLSEDIVRHAQGLPLALKVLGSYLSGKTVDQWQSALESFEDYTHDKIMKILRISYDGLSQSEKGIFLDIACFFKGKKEDWVTKILTSCGFHPVNGIDNLIKKSLVTISDNRVSMHDLLQEMGRQIVREEHPLEPGKRSRLWRFDDVHHVLTENTGTEAVEGIVVDMPKQGNITCLNRESFRNMKNLRLLEINNVHVHEGLDYLPNELRYLHWATYPLEALPSSFLGHKLCELNLSHSNIKYLPMGITAFDTLKTIKLSYCHNLIETPDFTKVPNLEMLDLEGCISLCKVHDSVGSLRLLTVLNLRNCKNLESFPSNVEGLKALKILNLQGCSKLEKLPENLGELECLEKLDAGRTAIAQVPPSIVLLKNLKILDLSDCNLTDGSLPNDLGSLCSLKELNLSKNKFVSLPESINQLSKLKILCLEKCQMLQTIPELPPKIIFLWADDCGSLKDVSSVVGGGHTSKNIALHFFNCLKLSENQGQENSLAVLLLKHYLQQSGNCLFNQCHIFLPASEIPKWFSCRSDGDSVEIGLRPNWLNDEFMGIAICGVFAPDPEDLDAIKSMSLRMSLMRNDYSFSFDFPTTVESDHLWQAYVSRVKFENDCSYKITADDTSSDDESDYFGSRTAPVSGSTCIHVGFGIGGSENSKSKVIKCGIRLVYKNDLQYFQELPSAEGFIFHQNHNCSPSEGRKGCWRRFFNPTKLEYHWNIRRNIS